MVLMTISLNAQVYSVIGSFSGWNEDIDMTEIDDNTYYASVENLAVGSHEFKIRQDHDWSYNWGDDGTGNVTTANGNNFVVDVTEEGSTIEIQFKPTVPEIKIELNNEIVTQTIYYNFISKGKAAEVISKPNGRKYFGNIEIPATVMHDGEEYTVTKISEDAFFECTDLLSVSIPNTVTSIEVAAFGGCVKLKTIDIPSNVKTIGWGAFQECSTLTTVSIPNSVTSIGGNAFEGCKKLESIIIPSSVTSIGQNAFKGCSNLSSIYVDSYNEYYDSRNNCNALIESSSNTLLAGCKNSTIPQGVKSISPQAFKGCIGLTSVNIPTSVEIIGSEAFEGCVNLTSLNISNGVTSICSLAFKGCAGLTSVIIPNSVNYIESKVFQGCTALASVTLSNNINSIGSYTFDGCTSLASVTLPSSLTSISDHAFGGCTKLSSVSIPNNVTFIGLEAFDGCTGLKTLILGNKLDYISLWAFELCEDLTDVYCYAENVPSTESDYIFHGSHIDYATLHVPAKSVNLYNAKAPWNQFKDIVALNDEEIPETPKCATPEISYENGRVKFTCETQDVEFITSVTLADEHSYYDDEIQLSQKYKITVYATKAGYENSDVTTREIEIKGDNKAIVVGDVDGDGKVNVADHVKLSDIIMEKK